MICPLFATGLRANPSKGERQAECVSHQCAWWNPESKQCIIPRSLELITKALKDLACNTSRC